MFQDAFVLKDSDRGCIRRIQFSPSLKVFKYEAGGKPTSFRADNPEEMGLLVQTVNWAFGPLVSVKDLKELLVALQKQDLPRLRKIQQRNS